MLSDSHFPSLSFSLSFALKVSQTAPSSLSFPISFLKFQYDWSWSAQLNEEFVQKWSTLQSLTFPALDLKDVDLLIWWSLERRPEANDPPGHSVSECPGSNNPQLSSHQRNTQLENARGDSALRTEAWKEELVRDPSSCHTSQQNPRFIPSFYGFALLLANNPLHFFLLFTALSSHLTYFLKFCWILLSANKK